MYDNGAGDSRSQKSMIGPVMGGVVGVLVVAFVVGALMMRYWNRRKKSQQQLDTLLDQNHGSDHVDTKGRREHSGDTTPNGTRTSSAIRLSSNLDMAEVGGSGAPQQRYQQAFSGDYLDLYKQYDLYPQRPLSQSRSSIPPGFYQDLFDLPNEPESSSTLPWLITSSTGIGHDRFSKAEMEDLETPVSPGRNPQVIPDDDIKVHVPERWGQKWWRGSNHVEQ